MSAAKSAMIEQGRIDEGERKHENLQWPHVEPEQYRQEVMKLYSGKTKKGLTS